MAQETNNVFNICMALSCEMYFYDNYLNFLLYININFRGAVRTNRDQCPGTW